MAYDLGDAINMKNAMRLASYMKHSPILQIGAESPIILRDGESTTVSVYYWGDGVLTASSDDPLLTVTVSGRTLTLTKAAGANPEATITVSVAGTNDYTPDSAYINVAKGYRYGYRINKNDSNPTTRVEYLYDAVGQTPAYMDYTLGIFNYGSWGNKWFVTENKPLMLWSDGTVDYYLDPDNYDLKADGTPSDVSNTAYDGNAMAQFPLCWIKRWEDTNYEYEVVSDVQWDSDYKAYAHTRADGSIADFFYWSMFGGSGNASKIRSFSGQTLSGSLTAAQETAGCQANGVKWYKHTWSLKEFIRTLLVLMGKSTDTQAIFGNGNCSSASSASGLLQTGTLKDKGQFCGYDTNNQQVKVFHVEKFWGDQWDSLAGLIYSGGKIYVKMTPEGLGYRVTDVNGYTNTGITLAGTNGGYINKCKCTEFGIIPTKISGSGTTYYSDGALFNNSQLDYLLVGASASNVPAFGGFFAFHVAHDPSSPNWAAGCGLSCEMPAPTV